MKNREIKFRGLNSSGSDSWHYGVPIKNKIGTYIILDANHHICDQYSYIEIDEFRAVYPKTITQYTGLKDKNNVEIYEGDIIKYRYFHIGTNKEIVEYYKYGVVLEYAFISWKISGFNILDKKRTSNYYKTKKEKYKHTTAGEKWIDRNQLHIHSLKNIEVVGNIYENKELLEEMICK